MSLDSRRSFRKRLFFLGMVALAVYALLSIAIAINTADTCGGNEHAPKHWAVVPPHWVCE